MNNKLKAFLSGWTSIFDLTGGVEQWLPNFPDFSNGPEQDANALAGDWQQVGNDLRKAMDYVGEIIGGQPR
jgi:hypothetical protein